MFVSERDVKTLGVTVATGTAVTGGTVVNKLWVDCNDGCSWIEPTDDGGTELMDTGGVKGCGEAVAGIDPLWIFANSCSNSWRRDPGLWIRTFILS